MSSELKYRRRLQRVVAVCGLFACMSAVIVFQHHQVQTQAEQIKSLKTSIQTQEARILNLTGEIERLEQEADNVRLENATSRGAKRTATITAYTWTGSKTASGTWPKEGRTVAGPRNVPFGTVVWIDGIGERVVEDRTHQRYDGRYDVYMDSETECLNWGIQERMIR